MFLACGNEDSRSERFGSVICRYSRIVSEQDVKTIEGKIKITIGERLSKHELDFTSWTLGAGDEKWEYFWVCERGSRGLRPVYYEKAKRLPNLRRRW